MGKSRNARNLCDRLADERYQTIQFNVSPYNTNTALYPAIRFSSAGRGLDQSGQCAQAQLQKLNAMARESEIENQDNVIIAARICPRSAGDRRDPQLTVSSEKRKDMTLEALVHILERLAKHSPISFMVEDAHWLDPTTLDLLTPSLTASGRCACRW